MRYRKCRLCMTKPAGQNSIVMGCFSTAIVMAEPYARSRRFVAPPAGAYPTTAPSKLQRWVHEHTKGLNRAAMASIVASVAVVVWVLPVRPLAILIQSGAERLGFWGFTVYAVAFLLMSILSVPVWTMPFVAGAVFGTVWGTVIASVSCVVSAAVCFLIARALRETWLRKWFESSARMRALERVVEVSNWKIVAAVRLSHFMTFGMQNYAFGLTKIGFWTFLITTWLVTLPGTLLQVYLGDLGFTSVEAWEAESINRPVWALKIGGLVVMATAVGYLGYRMRAAYRQAAAEPLAQALSAEASKESNLAHWPLITLILIGVASLLLAIAVWCVAQREMIRESIHRASLGALEGAITLHLGSDVA